MSEPLRRDARGRQIEADPCPGCGKLTKRRPRSGKLRHTHLCPHKRPCAIGDPLWGAHYTRPRCEDCIAEAPASRSDTWV